MKRTYSKTAQKTVAPLLALITAGALMTPAKASHYRFANLSYKATGNAGEVEFKFSFGIQQFNPPAVGTVVSFETFNFGDNTSKQIYLKVVANSTTENWYVGDMVNSPTNQVPVRKVYSGAGPYTAGFASCCRINDPGVGGGNLTAQTIVRPFSGNSSPVSSALPILTVASGPAVTFQLPAQDPDGDSLRYRLATFAESGIAQPANMSINSSTGQVVWNNALLNKSTLYAAQFIVEDLDLAGNAKTRIPVDVLLKINSSAGVAPTAEVHTNMIGQNEHGPITVPFDTPVSFHVHGSDADAGASVTLNTGGLPSGATIAPTLPATGNGNIHGAFNWTPTKAQIGTHVISFSVTDNTGFQALTSMTINVINNATIANSDEYDTVLNQTLTVPAPGVLANDKDADNDALTATIVSNPINGGSVTLNPNGSFTYKPKVGYVGIDSFNYKANDGTADSNPATVTINVLPGNRSPIVSNQTESTPEDTAKTVTIRATDPDGDSLFFNVTKLPVNGTLNKTSGALINGSIEVIYTPKPDYNGPDAFEYTISDGEKDSAATVTVTVNAVNDAPVAVDDAASTDEDTPVTIDAKANDTDVDGDTLTVTVGEVTGGTATVVGGKIVFTPAANSNDEATIAYTVGDGKGKTDEGKVTVTINAVNDAPVAVDDTATTDEDTAVTINAKVNDTDVDGDTLKVTAVASNYGTATVNADGTIQFTPAANFNDVAPITYTISDGKGKTDDGKVTVTVNAVNDVPVATDGKLITNEDTQGSGTLQAKDIDSSKLTFVAVTQPTHGSVIVNADGTFTYTPDADYNDADIFTFKANDGALDSNVATVNISVTSVNDAPVAVNDAATTDEDTAVTLNAKANDTDVDKDVLHVSAVTQGKNGSVVLNPDGTVTYTPETDFNGTDTFSYTISDSKGGSDATVTVTVNAVNDAPVAVDDTAKTDEDTGVIIDAKVNDTDVDKDTLSITAATATNGTATVIDGKIEFKPTADFNGVVTITYTVSDDKGKTDDGKVTVTVNAVNDAPVASPEAATTNEDVVLNGSVKATDIDSTTLTYAVVAQPLNGKVVVNADGTYTYTPDENYHGADSFTFKANDGALDSGAAKVSMTVTPVNDLPVALNDVATTDEDTAVTVNAKANDTDVDGDALKVSAVTQGTNGSVVINADGTVTYTPNADFNTTDTFTYTISDGKGGSDATVTVTVKAVNDAPVAVKDTATTDEDTAVTIKAKDNDTDVDGDMLKVTAATSTDGVATVNADGTIEFKPAANLNGEATISYTISDSNGGTANGTIAVTVNPVNDVPVATPDAITTDEDKAVGGTLVASDIDKNPLTYAVGTGPSHGSVVINADGTFTYTPKANYFGDDSFTFQANDGTVDSVPVTVDISVKSVNDLPVAVNDAATTDEDTAVTLNAKANDTDVDGDALKVSAVTQGTNGSVVINADGTVTYTPNADFNTTDTFTYTISDGKGGSDATVTVTVKAVNDAPIAVEDLASTDEDTPVTINAKANDTDVDGDTLTVTKVEASNGTATIVDGKIVFTPTANFNGTATINYTISDGNNATADSTVTVTVTAVNDVPVAQADTASTLSVTPVTVQVLNNDSDVETAKLSLKTTLVSPASNGTVTHNADGSFTYTPAVGFSGTDTFSYTASDGDTTSAPVTVTITVTQPGTTLGSKVTGSGSVSGATTGRSSLTLNLQSDTKTGVIKGKLEYGGSSEGVYIRSTSISGIVFDGTSVRIFGKATVNGAGSYDFVADVTDNGEPGDADTFTLRVSNGYTNGPKTLTGGNIQVHK